MPIGAEKAGFFAAGTITDNYFGDESLGDCQFGASSITQTGDSTEIDTVLTTGSESGGPGSSSYGNGDTNQLVPNSSACYEFTVANTSGTYDGDMVVLNFTNLTVDASTTITTVRPCRGILVYCSGNAVLNGYISMNSRGGDSDPTVSGGGDASAVSATGLRLPLFNAAGTDTLTAADFAGSGTASVAAVANQDGIAGNGSIYIMSQTGGAGATVIRTDGAAGTTGGTTLSTGGGGSGFKSGSSPGFGDGGTGGAFSGGAGGGSSRGAVAGEDGESYGGKGGDAGVGGTGEGIGGGTGNPGGSSYLFTDCNGVGGIIWLVVKGDVTIASGGGAVAQTPEAYDSSHYGASGAGGGSVFVLHAGTLSNSGTISAAGGPRGGYGHGHYAGNGGAGGTHTATIND